MYLEKTNQLQGKKERKKKLVHHVVPFYGERVRLEISTVMIGIDSYNILGHKPERAKKKK